MRVQRTSSSLFALTSALLLQSAAASFIPDLFQGLNVFGDIEKRCAVPCGYYGQLCCNSDQYCYTDANGDAACGQGAGATVTATYSSYVGGTTPAPSTQCSYAQGQTQCGSTCCGSGYYCQANNVCVQVPGGSSGYYSGVITVTTIITNTAGVPVRPTTQTILTLTSSVTGTTAFSSAVSTNPAFVGTTSSSGGLSGGAIAGIVIGVLAGIFILFLICACCCFKGLIDGLLAIFGLGPRRKRVTEETIVEERRTRRNWFGARPQTTTVVEEEKRTSGFGRTLGVAGFLGTTAVLLGLKRRSDRKDEANSASYYGSDYYSYDYTSDSSPSSITRTSRRSRSRR